MNYEKEADKKSKEAQVEAQKVLDKARVGRVIALRQSVVDQECEAYNAQAYANRRIDEANENAAGCLRDIEEIGEWEPAKEFEKLFNFVSLCGGVYPRKGLVCPDYSEYWTMAEMSNPNINTEKGAS